MNGHLALLGDSILDNGAYTEGGPDVVTHMRAVLPAGWRATLLALDGSLIGDLDGQLSDLPSDTTHIVVSVGGNNVLMNLDILRLRVRSEPEAPVKLGYRVALFERAYRVAIDRVVRLGKEMAVCTIYNANLDNETGAEALGFTTEEAAAALVILTTFNDAILRVAFEANLRVIELRLVCTEPAGYANAIEPSVQGGEKIAGAIMRSLGLASPAADHSRVYSRKLAAVLGLVVLGDVLLDELGADADVVEWPVVVRDIGRPHDLGPIPVLDLAIHVEDPDLELAVRHDAANPCQTMTAGFQPHDVLDCESLRPGRTGRAVRRLRSRLGRPLRAQLTRQPRHRIVDLRCRALFQWDDRVVGDLDVFGADFLTALGDVAHADTRLAVQEAGALPRVQRMHLERGDSHHVAGSVVGRLIVVVA